MSALHCLLHILQLAKTNCHWFNHRDVQDNVGGKTEQAAIPPPFLTNLCSALEQGSWPQTSFSEAVQRPADETVVVLGNF